MQNELSFILHMLDTAASMSCTTTYYHVPDPLAGMISNPTNGGNLKDFFILR